MDKAAIKLHKMNIFPKVPPLYTHLPSTFLPVFSGTMLPNGLPVSCLPPPDSIPPIVGATTGRPRVSLKNHVTIRLPYLTFVCFGQRSPDCRATTGRPRVSGVICTCRDRKKGRSMTAPTNPMSKKGGMPLVGMPPFFGAANGIRVSPAARSSAALTGLAAARSRSGSDSPPDCHSLPSRRFATTGLSFTPPATASFFTTANAFPRETLPRTNGIPEQSTTFVALQIPLAKNSHIHKGCESFLELLMGFGSRLRARSSAALTVPRTVIHYRSPPNPMSKKGGMPMRGIPPFWSC